jgi:hypothetical protein
MFSSCAPCSAFVDGVKIGVASFSASKIPTGIGILCTVPLFLYSDHAEPRENFVTKINKFLYEKKAYQLDNPVQ